MTRQFFLLGLVILAVGWVSSPSMAGSPFQDVLITTEDQMTEPGPMLDPAQPRPGPSTTPMVPRSPGRGSPSLMADPLLGIARIGIIRSGAPEPLPTVSPANPPDPQPTRGRDRLQRVKARLARRPHGTCPQQGRVMVSSAAPQPATAASPSATPTKRWTIKIPEFLRKILNWFGANLPKGSKIVIIIGGGTTTPPPSPPPTTTPPTTPPPGSLPGTISGLKKYMTQRFGITPVDGDGASWSQRQLEEANKVLATLPAGFRSCTTKIQRDRMFQSPNVLGYVRMGVPTVHLMDSACKQGTFQGTLVHEMTHCFQAKHPEITQLWKKTFWPMGGLLGPWPPSVSSYGNSSYLEDMAESVRAYWQDGPAMKARQPKRYEFIKTYVMSGREF
ncbi:MAG: hypothetical protein OZSIB_3384 [Candidatus Ozemobacter sibiricus]|jgi:hypothetical protein|uniref:Basic proline-rich protein n=1 Tax=Candidatus Ozemobacter sibiricus TaxID=2268124 RepID=A0A367ZS45_9BACT|nr:MAG: hypothetical protein OZSIB_3384 [Candidatus Ozemobacter sibiricus]